MHSFGDGVYDPATGHYGTVVIKPIEDKDRALEIKRALYRSANYLHRNKKMNLSMHAEVVPLADGAFSVEFKAINKSHARAYVLQKYGTDRSKFPYNPMQKDKKTDE